MSVDVTPGPPGPIGPAGPPGSPAAQVLQFGANAISSTTTTRYLFPCYVDALAPLAAIRYICPFACNIDRMYVHHNIPGGNGNNIVYTLRKNSVATALAVTLASTGVTASDLVNTIAVAQGDFLDIEVTKALSIGATPNDIMLTARLQAI